MSKFRKCSKKQYKVTKEILGDVLEEYKKYCDTTSCSRCQYSTRNREVLCIEKYIEDNMEYIPPKYISKKTVANILRFILLIGTMIFSLDLVENLPYDTPANGVMLMGIGIIAVFTMLCELLHLVIDAIYNRWQK